MISINLPQRFSLTHSCENTCAYCPETTAPRWTDSEALQKEAPLTLSCNSLFAENLSAILFSAYQQTSTVNLEVNMTSAALPRWSEKLISLRHPQLSLIVIIDQWHPGKIAALEKIDAGVSEYRVLPSKIYPVELFERELPPFVLKKLCFAKVPALNSRSAFLTSDELYLECLKPQPVTFGLKRKLSDTQNYAGAELGVHQLSDDSLWISVQPLMADKNLASEINQIASTLKPNEVLWFGSEESKKLLTLVTRYRRKREPFYFLDNLLVPAPAWNSFVSFCQGRLMDSFTWSQFVASHAISVVHRNSKISSRYASLLDIATLCHRRMARLPEAAFYEDFFCLFSTRPQWRHWHLEFLKFATAVWALIVPRRLRDKSSRQAMSEAIDNARFELGEMRSLWQRRTNDAYWRLHGYAWMLYRFFWHNLYATRAKKRAYSILIGWKLYHIFWHNFYAFGANRRRLQLYLHIKSIHISSAIVGFFYSLFEFPDSWQHEPFYRRAGLKTSHFLKKWAWLLLKTVGLR